VGCNWEKVPFGSTGKSVTPLGLGSGYGVSGREVERAVERGIDYLYWGSYRNPDFAEGVRNLGPAARPKLFLVVQSYTRIAGLMRGSLERALRDLRTEYADLLLLGWWNEPPPRALVDAAVALKKEGKAKGIMISCHRRETFKTYIEDPVYDGIMLRYSAAHPGAESDVFRHLESRRPGVVSYTATRWRTLLDPQNMPAGERTPTATDCYRFALSNPHIDVCLAGPADARQLDEALLALDKGPLSPEEMDWMRRVGKHVHDNAPTKGQAGAIDIADKVMGVLNRVSHAIYR